MIDEVIDRIKDASVFESRSGAELHLMPVNADAIFELYNRMGMYDALNDVREFDGSDEWAERWESTLSLDERLTGAQLTQQLFNYCAGWGVTDDPPPEAIDELKLIGRDTSSRRAARIDWLRFIVLEPGEAAELIGRVMALTQMRGMKQEQTVREKEARIAELEAQVAELRSEKK